ncbi:hypothetical protein [Chromobacterium phragmitis]|uniref:Uncharacterized protein n=1 Tax=Chromobacterium phragmitis TaxID=2202141 RepID=A0A344UPJ3_9NEIS|nr:hypothetical protein [Chromobacterium phragmitis]AXE37130.1 hypothetical protein DK843_22530 [Chromobacterium phragmitis]AXE37191.1 hypothetical protein DK843_22850 [Chromobacterium phragmitis]
MSDNAQHLEFLDPDELAALKDGFLDDVADTPAADDSQNAAAGSSATGAGAEGDAAAAAGGQEVDPQAAATQAGQADAAPASQAAAAAVDSMATAQAETTKNGDTNGQQDGTIANNGTMPSHAASRDFKSEVQVISDELVQLAAKYDDGDITTAEYEQQRMALADKRDDLRAEQRDANNEQRRQEAQQQRERQEWGKTCDAFLFQQHKDFYMQGGQPNEMRLGAIDALVKQIARAQPELSGAQVLAQAHQQVQQAFTPAAAAEEKPASAENKTQPAKLPPNLGSAPAAEADLGNDADPLTRLRGDDLEQKLQKMTPAQRDAWLKTS